MIVPLASAWEIVVTGLALLAGVVIPLELGMGLRLDAGFFLAEVVLTVVFSLDALFRVRELAAEKTARHGQKTILWLFADVLAALPFVFLLASPAWQLLRLLKVVRVLDLMRTFWHRNIHQSLLLRLGMFTFWLAIATHWLSCTWLALRGTNPLSDQTTNYISSLYFCITTLTTVGFGDVTPTNNAERLFVIGMMLFGVGVYGFAIGNVASMLTKIDPARAHHIENMERLNAFMKYKSLPLSLRKRLTQYYAYLWEQRLGYDEMSVLASLPPSLKTEVSLHLNRDVIQKVPLFQGASEEFVRDIALQMSPVIFLPGDYVFRAGEVGDDMYFVSRGDLEVFAKDGQTLLRHLTDGDFFGEIALILNQPRSASVRAKSYCDLYKLNRELFERVLAHYPDVAEKIKEQAKERSTRN